MTRKVWLLGFILFCGAVLRFYDLSAESLWADEGITVRTVSDSFTAMQQILSKAIHPPLHYLILHPLTHIFGNSEFVVRMPSVIFGIVSIFMTYVLGRRLFNTPTGFIAAGLVALSYFQIRYSQEARNYALLTMLALFSYYYFVRLLEKPSRKHTAGYLIVSVLLLYTHFFGLFTIFSQNLYMLIRACVLGKKVRPSLLHWIGLQCATALLFMPWVSVLIHHVSTRQSNGAWQARPSLYTLSSTFGVYAGSLPLLILFFAIMLLAAGLWLFKSGSNASQAVRFNFSRMEPLYIVLTWLGSYTLVPFILSQIMTSLYHYRYTIVGSIAFYLLMALALRQLQRARFLFPVALGGIVVLSCLGLYNYYTEINKEPWRDAVAYVDAKATPRDLLLFTSGFLLDTNFNYYSHRDDLNKKPFPSLNNIIRLRLGKPYDYQAELKRIGQGHDNIWLILSHAHKFKKQMINILSKTHVVKDHEKYIRRAHLKRKLSVGIEVIHFAKRLQDTPYGVTNITSQQ